MRHLRVLMPIAHRFVILLLCPALTLSLRNLSDVEDDVVVLGQNRLKTVLSLMLRVLTLYT